MQLGEATELLKKFAATSVRADVAEIEAELKGRDGATVTALLADHGVDAELISAALLVKDAASQIDVLLHAIGMLTALPLVLEDQERVEYASLGAGNTGRKFDLETDRRVAEFKFTRWRGGSESIRQNALFKDFYLLAEEETWKRKLLYVVGAEEPLKFLNGNRSLDSVMSRNNKLLADFRSNYGSRFTRMRDYYDFRRDEVEIVDLIPLCPHLKPTVCDVAE
jgi:hypothetical protein